MPDPVAFLITWTTYGTWLHGDARGWVQSGDFGVRPPDPDREARMRGRMVESTIRRHAALRGWELRALNVRSNHVHLVITADARPETIMEQLKAWCTRRLNEEEAAAGRAPRRKWWTEHGSTKWINDERYLRNAIEYVLERQ